MLRSLVFGESSIVCRDGANFKINIGNMIMSSREQLRMTVVGAGSWGTAIGAWLARNGHEVHIWDVDGKVIEDINSTRFNSRYLPECELPQNLHGHLQLETAMNGSSCIVLVVPSRVFSAALNEVASHMRCMDTSSAPVVIWGTKGFVSDSGDLPSDAAQRILDPSAVAAVLSGPSFALEIINGLPAGLDLACKNSDQIERIADWFRSDRVLIYTTSDVVGVQVGGAVKNIIAVAAGLADGLGFGSNARCMLITRGLAEIGRLSVAMGGQASTLSGLSGMGDTILTCSTDLSRNRRLGLAIGKGQSAESAVKEIGQEVEGIEAVRIAFEVSKRLDVFMPLTERVYRVLFENLHPMQAAQELMAVGPSLKV